MSTGTAGSGQTVGLAVPEDLVSVPVAAQAVGFTVPAVYKWIKSGRLTAQPSPRGHRVSLSAVQALAAPPDPQTPPEARPARAVARAMGLASWRIHSWAGQGLLPSWRSPQGRLVCEGDVRAVAQKQGALPPSNKAGE